ncbi:hypothetical protein [Parasitella parasitica]|uniref:Uncharacterized protein n=1 Tax=Parasitella parasitica TaxID=35722 RepID=A0A0B7NM95_9FUNG|nr:hypothetical protein [Parasitella parasitica]
MIETNLSTSKTFYNHKSAPFRFHDYQGKQRATAEMANILINGGERKKKRRAKNLAKEKSNQGPRFWCHWGASKRASRNFDSVVVGMNEFRTSKVRNSCKGKELKPIKLSDQKYFQGILDCKLCHILWDISLSVWEGKGTFGLQKKNRRKEHGIARKSNLDTYR